jgi:hypothetical protein
MGPSLEERAELLTVRANLVRSRLLGTIGALDGRLRAALGVERQVKRHAGLLATVAVVLLTGVAAVAVYRTATAERRRRRERWRMLRRVWMHPERTARAEESIVGKVARTLLVGAVRFVVKRVAVQLAENEAPLALTVGRPDVQGEAR